MTRLAIIGHGRGSVLQSPAGVNEPEEDTGAIGRLSEALDVNNHNGSADFDQKMRPCPEHTERSGVGPGRLQVTIRRGGKESLDFSGVF